MVRSSTILFALLYFALTVHSCDGSLPNQDDDFKWVLLSEAEPIAEHAAEFRSVYFFNSLKGIAISPISIMSTSDGGANWESVRTWEGRGYWALIRFKNQFWVVGSEEGKVLILKNDRDGFRKSDWLSVPIREEDRKKLSDGFTVFYDLCFSTDGSLWIAGDGGILTLTLEDESLYLKRLFKTSESVHGISCGRGDRVLAISNKKSFQFINSQWISREWEKSVRFNRVRVIENDVWLIGQKESSESVDSSNGILIRSRDNGLSWETISLPGASALRDLEFQGNRGWVVGDKGSIFASSNGGEAWEGVKSPTKNGLVKIFALDSRNIWIAGERLSVIKYQDMNRYSPIPNRTVW